MNEAVAIGIRALEVLFFGGMIGSLILVLIAAFEDFATLMGREPYEQPAGDGNQF